MALRVNNVGQPVFYTAAGAGDNTPFQRLASPATVTNPNFTRSTRISYNPSSVYGQIANNRLSTFNGNIATRSNYGVGNVSGNNYFNLADNSLANGFNMVRQGFNYDMQRFAGTRYVDPRYGRTGLYPNGVPYPAATHYRGAVPYGIPYSNAYYGRNNYASPYYGSTYLPEYPYTSPECARFAVCERYNHPNDCRSCVSSRGGVSHCADQICGPSYYN
ncbi:putative orfan [Tupanvirus soda lake]|uniref:Orfan n=1 Tax=Tupanvirus deep ocean TaxID=2126984 RepID=A0AC59HBW5_9VIRU|nr:putative orfan [Tupanvirus soda lake]AUL77471.2 putative orfan [Tupanvirus soda lake]